MSFFAKKIQVCLLLLITTWVALVTPSLGMIFYLNKLSFHKQAVLVNAPCSRSTLNKPCAVKLCQFLKLIYHFNQYHLQTLHQLLLISLSFIFLMGLLPLGVLHRIFRPPRLLPA